MPMNGRARMIAETAWDFMRAREIIATPRNYELCYTYGSEDAPALTERLNDLMRDQVVLTQALLDDLHREFVKTPADIDTIQEGASELRQLATDLVDRVRDDRTYVDALSRAVGGVTAGIRPDATFEDVRRAAATLGNASVEASERFQAMEKLLSASVNRITDLKKCLARAEAEATTDALTGIANRRLFNSQIEREALRAASTGRPVSLLMLDIDRFKRFNDTYGHSLGDHVLRLVARLLKENVKGRDTAARFGGEEFAIILPGADLAGARSVAEQIRGVLEQRPIVNRSSGQRFGVVTCSIGVAQYRAGEPVHAWINRADKALYRAKEAGRNTVAVDAEAGS